MLRFVIMIVAIYLFMCKKHFVLIVAHNQQKPELQPHPGPPLPTQSSMVTTPNKIKQHKQAFSSTRMESKEQLQASF